MVTVTYQCGDCKGRFTKPFFQGSSVCRMCVHRQKLQEAVIEWQTKYRDLEKKFDTLQDFVTANVGVTPPSLVERTPAVSASPQDAPPASQEDAPPASQEDDFQPVRNGAKPKRPARKLQTPTTFNRFQVLGETVDDEFETRLVGDSMVRGQLVEFCGRSSNGRRKRFCYPGARLDDVTAVCDDVTSEADENTLLIVHAGTNDVQTTRSEELLEKYRNMIKRFKSKVDSKNIIISGILPRVGAEQIFYNRAFSINNRLQTVCSQENVQFINLWDQFYYDKHLYQTDGIHLNSVGAARFGRLLCNQVSLHKAKNVTRAAPTDPP